MMFYKCQLPAFELIEPLDPNYKYIKGNCDGKT